MFYRYYLLSEHCLETL